MIITVSFVLMSLSTVSLLNDFFTASPRAEFSARGPTAISVTIKHSMVAMFGLIMPAPFAMPAIVPFFPAIFIFLETIFGKVSVVIIAAAASFIEPAASLCTASGMAFLILFIGRLFPITPVDET